MPEVVKVSEIETLENLKTYIPELFQKGRYEEITNAIGMHSVLIDPQHTKTVQSQLYHIVLNLIKENVNKGNTKKYSSWLTSFPVLLADIVAAKQVVTDKAAADVLASHHNAYGPFRSLDEFFFWAITDRMLPLDQILAYVAKTLKTHR